MLKGLTSFKSTLNVKSVSLTLLLLVMLPMTAGAVSITDLFNTGVDAAGNVLGDSVADTHYTITAPTGFIATTVPAGFPIGPWVANNSQSRWIGPNAPFAAGPDGGQMTFSTSFTIGTGADLSTAQITGLGAADDLIADVLLNGTSLGSLFNGFTAFQSFSISSGFRTGTNTLDFIVQNSSGFNVNPTGLRIENISGQYNLADSQPVPEPSTMLLMASGLAGLAAWRRMKTPKS